MSFLLLDDSEIIEDQIPTEEIEGELAIDEATPIDAEIQELEVAITVTEEQATQAEALQEEVEATLESGGLTPEAAVFVHRNLAALAALNGQRNKTYFTVQSFSAAGSRKEYTMQALETVKEFVKRYWDRLKNFLRKWYLKVMEFYDKHASGVGRLAKAAKSLAKKANDSSGKPKEPKIKISPTTHKRLVKTSKADLKDAASNLNALAASVKDVPAMSRSALSTFKDYASNLTENNRPVADLGDLIKVAGDKANPDLIGAAAIEDLKKGDYKQSKTNELGGWVYQVNAQTKKVGKDARIDIITGFTVSTVDKFNTSETFRDDDEVEALDRAKIVSLANAVERLATTIYKAEGEMRVQKKNLDAATDAGDKAIERGAKATDKPVKEGEIRGVDLIAAATAYVRFSQTHARLAIKKAAESAQAGYQYANASYRNLSTAD